MAFIKENYIVTIEDVNPDGLCTNKAILKMFENIACTHSDMVGLGVNDIERTRLTWFILHWKLKVLSRPRYGEKLTVTTWAKDTGNTFTHRDFELTNQSGEVVAFASSKWALIDIDKGLIKISDEIMARYQPEDKHVFDNTPLKRLREPDEYSKNMPITVLRRDIDINRHVHNLNYFDFAYEIIPDEIFYSELSEVEITYKTEAKLGDKLNVLYSFTSSEHYVVIKNVDTDKTNVIIKLK